MENDYLKLVEKISLEVLDALNGNNLKKTSWEKVGDIDSSFGGSLKVLTDVLSLEKMDLIIGEFKKGESLKRHYHKAPTEEVYFIIEGEMEVMAGNEKVIMRKGDLLSIPPGVIHWPINHKDEICRVLFMLSPREKKKPVVME